MPDELKPSPEAVQVAKEIADRTDYKPNSDNYARVYQGAYFAAALVIDRALRPATMPGDVVEDQCANCHGMIGELASGRDPEELCDTCYEDSQAALRPVEIDPTYPGRYLTPGMGEALDALTRPATMPGDEAPVRCHDCGRGYGVGGWIEAVVPHDVWALISPTGDEGGILCINCMADRLTQKGLTDVPLRVAAGPFIPTGSITQEPPAMQPAIQAAVDALEGVRCANAGNFKRTGAAWEAYDTAVLDCIKALATLRTVTEQGEG